MVNALPEDPGSIFSTYPEAQKHQELQKRRDYCPLVTSVGHKTHMVQASWTSVQAKHPLMHIKIKIKRKTSTCMEGGRTILSGAKMGTFYVLDKICES